MELSGIKGKVALITGANSGIGAAIALKLAEGGAKIAIHFHPGSKPRARILHAVSDVSETERVLSQVRDIGAEGMSVGADLLDRDSPGAVFDAVERKWGSVDFLINNAAHCEEPDSIRTVRGDTLDHHFAVNARTPTLLAHELATRKHKGGPACIINISTDGARSFPGQIGYGASKFALESLTRSMAIELGPAGIRVNAVAPGPVQTGWITRDLEDQVMPSIPLGRLGAPADIAHAVVFLCSDQAGWITGQILQVSGGHAI